MLKGAAVVFALGVITFSFAYYSNYQSYRVLDTLEREREQVERTKQPIPKRTRGSTSAEFALRSAVATAISFVLFHLGCWCHSSRFYVRNAETLQREPADPMRLAKAVEYHCQSASA